MAIDTFVTSRGRRDPIKVSLPADFLWQDMKRAVCEALSEDVGDWRFFDETLQVPIDGDSIPDFDPSSVLRLHCHPCRRVSVTVNFGADQVSFKLPPVSTVSIVLKRAVKKLGLDPDMDDAYLLVLLGSSESLPPDTAIGSLTGGEDCDVEFDLVLEPTING